jgi:ABC-type polysaccharide/polyol phosphate export permease
MVFLLSDLIFAALMTVLNVGFHDAIDILPDVLVQTTILSLIMALTGFGCIMLLKDFRQFSLAYLVIAIFAAAPVFLSANTSVKMAWIDWHPFYHVYMGLKNAYFGMPITNPVYYLFSACGIAILFLIVQTAFHKEMGKEG